MTGILKVMANTSSRTLRLLSLLQNHRYWAGTDLAGRLGVSPRTLRRDVDRLRDLGYPVEAHRGVDGGYQLAAGAVLPPLVVDNEEAVAIAVGLRLAAQGGGTGASAEAAARALAKVTQVMPPGLRRQVEAVAAMTESATWGNDSPVAPDVLAAAAIACRDAERIRFGYTAASGDLTRRHVEPHRLVVLDRRWYLVAYDLDRQDWRTFRLDRVTVSSAVPGPGPGAAGRGPGSAGRGPGAAGLVPGAAGLAAAGSAAAGPVTSAGARFRPREIPGGDAADFVRRTIATPSGSYDVEVIFEAPAATIRTRIGRWATIEDLGPGRCRARLTPPDASDWAVIALGVAGADFQVISPAGLAEQVREWGQRFSRAANVSVRAAGIQQDHCPQG
jgi:predicted DNA-binding transcriptional regulator YafY